ncbi:MAG TPA: lipid II flippase MurJ [Longimicrobium sp.]|nr:lipid II flippase MurJ [Longimicrobium sp.]
MRSVGILTLFNLLGAVMGVANALVIAALFGTTRQAELYFAAATLLGLVMSLSQSGQMGEILVPIYHRLRAERGAVHARAAFSVAVNWMFLACVGLSAVLWLFAPLMLRLLVPGFSAADQALGAALLRGLLPLVPIQVAWGLFRTLANAERAFGRPEAMSAIAQGLAVVVILPLAPLIGVWSLIVSLWVGRLLQLAGLAWPLRRMGYRHRWLLRVDGFSMRGVLTELAVTFSYVGANQVMQFGVNAGVSLLPQGTYAVFKYVQQLVSKTESIFLRPVSTVFFTHMSEALTAGASNLKRLAHAALRQGLLVWTLATVALVSAGRPLLEGALGGARFGPGNVALAYALLVFFYLLLPLSSLAQITRKTVVSVGGIRWQYLSTSVVQIVCGAMAWIAIPALGMPGLLLTLVVNYVGFVVAPMLVLAVLRRELVAFYPPRAVGEWLLAGAAGLAAGWLLGTAIPDPGAVLSRVGLVAWGMALAIVSAGVAAGAAWLLHVSEMRRALAWAARARRGAVAAPGGA